MILASLVLAACTTQYGNPITDSQLAQIKKGETTKSQLLSALGQPLTTARNSDGTQIMSWGYAKVGFAGSSYRNQGLSVILDENGKVVSYTTTDTASPNR